MSPEIVTRLCNQLDRLEERFDSHALDEARRDAELLAEVRALREEATDHKRKHRRWETRMWGLAASVMGFFGVQSWRWLTRGGQ